MTSKSLITLLGAGALVVMASAPALAGDSTTMPAPGIKLLARTTTAPNYRIFVATTLLCSNGIQLEARSSQATRITTEAWGTAVGAKVAVNGDFWRTDTTVPTVYGDAVGVGTRWPSARSGLGSEYAAEWYFGYYGWIAFGNGWVELDHTGYVKDHGAALHITQGFHGATRSTAIPSGTQALVSGFPELVVEGTTMSAFPDRGDCSLLEPRTAMGLNKDRSEFYLVTVDGRSTASVGMTCAQLAVLMKSIGAYTAINLDGGGSTQMYIAGRGTINQPSDGVARGVSNDWGVLYGGATMPPTSCFKAGGCFPSAIPEAAGSHFGDLPNTDGSAELAKLVVDRGYLGTCQASPAMFCPHCGLKRLDAIALVVRAAGLDTSHPPMTPTFSDVPATAAAFADVEAAAAAGLTTGCGGGKLCPGDVLLRGEVAALIARARHWTPPDAPPALADVAASHAYYSEIEAVAGYCAASACKAGSFCPDDAAARADAVMLVGAAFALPGATACNVPAGAGGDVDVGDDGHHSGCATGRGSSSAGILVVVAVMLRRRRR